MGVVFIPLGVGLYLSSTNVVDVSVRYDNCGASVCTLNITIPRLMNPPVYFFYELDNFYQNYRQYVSSLSETQLEGNNVSYSSLGACGDYATNPVGMDSANVTDANVRNPCGLIAASQFNDTFTMYDSDGNKIPWTDEGIYWPSDNAKFKPIPAGSPNFIVANTTSPDFIVWMQVAALPKFHKLYRIIHQPIPAGSYHVNATNVYPVSQFDGKKAIYISTTSWLGGRNDFLGLAYIVIGGLCIVLAIVFLLKHLISPRPLGDLSYMRYD